ncbi:MAG: nicotinamide mononucleotide transporter [Saprospiraceae bacterium]
MNLLYASIDIVIAEFLGLSAVFVMNHLLAKKNKNGWLFYFVSSLLIIYVFLFKDSLMSIINQSMMAILALKNYYYFNNSSHKYHQYFNRISIFVFIVSLLFINSLDGKSLSELLLWSFIIARTIFLGKNHISGWLFQILQCLTSIAFGLYRDMFLYVIVGFIFTIQSIYGYYQWQKTTPQK